MVSPKLSKISLPLLILLVLCEGHKDEDELEFKGKIDTVWFDPWIYPGDVWPPGSVDEYDLIKMLSTISTRFRKIMIPELIAPYGEHIKQDATYELIPVALAKFNLMHKHDDCQIPLELLLHYNPFNNSYFDHTLKLANFANSVFPGSVKELLLKFDDDEHPLTLTAAQNLTTSLDHARTALKSTPGIKLGAQLRLAECFSSEAAALKELVAHLDTIAFFREASAQEWELGLESQVSIIIRELEKCKRALAKISKRELKARFSLFFPDTHKPHWNQNFSLFVAFWEGMEKWASQSDTDIVMFEAFDMTDKSDPKLRTAGWWRARATWEGFIIEEKAAVAGKAMPLPTCSSSHSTSANFATTQVLLLMLIGAFCTQIFSQL